mmetsp:Transcript_50688/g.130735  ORF Transcript_50688/g.130735 Transcript_50688/m.130735 type:complete len:146 (-) Transcript_50688:283-720(-)
MCTETRSLKARQHHKVRILIFQKLMYILLVSMRNNSELQLVYIATVLVAKNKLFVAIPLLVLERRPLLPSLVQQTLHRLRLAVLSLFFLLLIEVLGGQQGNLLPQQVSFHRCLLNSNSLLSLQGTHKQALCFETMQREVEFDSSS